MVIFSLISSMIANRVSSLEVGGSFLRTLRMELSAGACMERPRILKMRVMRLRSAMFVVIIYLYVECWC